MTSTPYFTSTSAAQSAADSPQSSPVDDWSNTSSELSLEADDDFFFNDAAPKAVQGDFSGNDAPQGSSSASQDCPKQ